MTQLPQLLEKNRVWANEVAASDPSFFANLAKQQKPEYLWIGCADSRVPANQIIGLQPGNVFVHRNIANIVPHSDFNVHSVLEFAVGVLKVKHIIVCGHYGCGGVKAASENHQLGLIDNWLRHIRDVRAKHADSLMGLPDDDARVNRLCELNVIEQVRNVCYTTVVQQAWENKQELSVHGWIYGIQDGLIKDLNVTVDDVNEVASAYRIATGNTLPT